MSEYSDYDQVQLRRLGGAHGRVRRAAKRRPRGGAGSMSKAYNREGWYPISEENNPWMDPEWWEVEGDEREFRHLEEWTIEEAEAEFAKGLPKGPLPKPAFCEHELIAVYRIHYLRGLDHEQAVLNLENAAKEFANDVAWIAKAYSRHLEPMLGHENYRKLLDGEERTLKAIKELQALRGEQ